MARRKRKKKNWLQRAIRHPNRVRNYLRRVYGKRAFNKDGTIKMAYLKRALRRAERNGNKSLAAAIRLAMRLKRWARKR